MRLHDLDRDLAEFDPHNPEHYLDDEAFDVPVNPADRERDVLFLIRRKKENERLIAEVEATVAAERERWEAWEADRTAGLRREIVRIENAVEQWQRADGRLTFATPYGVTARLRERPAHIEFTDEAALAKWALESGYTDLVKIEPKKSEIKKLEPGPEVDGYVSQDDPTEKVTAVKLVIGLNGEDSDGDDLREIVPGVVLVTPVERKFSI
jgi:hypothetical protein